MAEGAGQQWRIRQPARRIAAQGERAQRIAVVGLAAGDEAGPVGLANLQEILPGHLQRGLNRLGPAGDEIGIGEAARFVANQCVGQFLSRRGREKAGMGIGEACGLVLDRLDNAGMLMTEATDRRPARGIQDFAPIRAHQPHTMAAGCDRWRRASKIAVDDAASCHGPMLAIFLAGDKAELTPGLDGRARCRHNRATVQ